MSTSLPPTVFFFSFFFFLFFYLCARKAWLWKHCSVRIIKLLISNVFKRRRESKPVVREVCETIVSVKWENSRIAFSFPENNVTKTMSSAKNQSPNKIRLQDRPFYSYLKLCGCVKQYPQLKQIQTGWYSNVSNHKRKTLFSITFVSVSSRRSFCSYNFPITWH